MTAALVAELRDRLSKARNAIDQLDTELVKAGNTPPDDSGVHLAIAQHHLESVVALLRASEARCSRHDRATVAGARRGAQHVTNAAAQ
jgi:hypothetical protein